MKNKVHGSTFNFLMHESVQKDLGLSAAQRERVKERSRDFGERSARLMTLMRSPSMPGHNPANIAAAGAALDEASSSAIAQILNPTQRQRLIGILIQQEGIFVVARPEVASRLNLSPAQVEGVSAIIGQYEAQLKQARTAMSANLKPLNEPGGVPDLNDPKTAEEFRRRSMMAVRTEHDLKLRAAERISKILTHKQGNMFIKPQTSEV